jgi:hypothetical protein
VRASRRRPRKRESRAASYPVQSVSRKGERTMKIRRRCLSTLFLLLTALCWTTAYSQEDAVLAPGNPPLKASVFAKTVILVEWALDLKFSEEERLKIANIMIKYWQENNRKEIENALEVVNIYDGLAKAGAEDRKKAKEIIRGEILKNLKSESDDELNRVVIGAYRAAQESASRDSFPAAGGARQNSSAPNALVGKWDSFGNYTSFEFFADGRYLYHARVKMDNLTCATTLTTNITGNYSLQGTSLILEPASGANEFKYSCRSATETKPVGRLEKKYLAVNFKRENGQLKACFTDPQKTESCYVKIE